MGYGWMMGLGQALGQIGSKQIPDYMDRSRQAAIDKQRLEQQAVENALSERRAKVAEDELGLSRERLTADNDYRTKTLENAERDDFFQHELPLMYGRNVAGSPFEEQLGKYGLGSMVGADGSLSLPYTAELERDRLNAQIAHDKASTQAALAQAGASSENARSLAAARQAEALRDRLSLVSTPDVSGEALYRAVASNPYGNSMDIEGTIATMQQRAAQNRLAALRTIDPALAAKFEAANASILHPPPKAASQPGAQAPGKIDMRALLQD